MDDGIARHECVDRAAGKAPEGFEKSQIHLCAGDEGAVDKEQREVVRSTVEERSPEIKSRGGRRVHSIPPNERMTTSFLIAAGRRIVDCRSKDGAGLISDPRETFFPIH